MQKLKGDLINLVLQQLMKKELGANLHFYQLTIEF